jgi:hypothetical protein
MNTSSTKQNASLGAPERRSDGESAGLRANNTSSSAPERRCDDKSAGSRVENTSSSAPKRRAIPSWFRLIVLVLAIFLVLVGITQGEVLTVLIKATHLCLECVGIG